MNEFKVNTTLKTLVISQVSSPCFGGCFLYVPCVPQLVELSNGYNILNKDLLVNHFSYRHPSLAVTNPFYVHNKTTYIPKWSHISIDYICMAVSIVMNRSSNFEIVTTQTIIDHWWSV